MPEETSSEIAKRQVAEDRAWIDALNKIAESLEMGSHERPGQSKSRPHAPVYGMSGAVRSVLGTAFE
jgi:hypothetical protein